MTLRTLVSLLALTSLMQADEPVTRKMLKPGLVAAFTEHGERPQTTTQWRLDPVPALLMNAGESMHPGQSMTPRARWTGYLQIVTPGEYTFFANVQAGAIRVNLHQEKFVEVLVGRASLVQTEFLAGQPVKLDAGFYRFGASFEMYRPAGDKTDLSAKTRRFELLWEGPGFQREPIPYFFFGHLPAQRDKKFNGDLTLDHGRFLFEELACAKCHTTANAFTPRSGPNLSNVGGRIYAGWLDAWLADPAKLRPHTTMPKMFADTDAGAAERHAVVHYLAGKGGPLGGERRPQFDDRYQRSYENGRKLFTTAGCAACHGTKLAGTMKRNADDDEPPPFDPTSSIFGMGTETGAQSRFALGNLGSKTTSERLAEYLRDPHKINSHGRMPNMNLTSDEARDLARHLVRFTEETFERTTVPKPKWTAEQLAKAILPNDDYADFDELKPNQQWRTLGKRLYRSKGCVNCHAMEEYGSPLSATDFDPLKDVSRSKGGCLAESPKSVKYALSKSQREALLRFLPTATLPVTPSPIYQTRADMKRYGCLNCHFKDGEGGIGDELAEAMKKLESAANEDDVQPPRLTGVGHKATGAWLAEVLLKGGRARPWMGLRMPQYGDVVKGMATGLPACEGLPPDVPAPKPKLTPVQIDNGRKLVGKEGLGCVACHDISGYVGAGTRGPDLATIDRRVRPDWYGRWMHNPQRLTPGTRMPSNFTDGRSVSTILISQADAQIDAIWTYLSLGPGLPLPGGLEPPGKGLPLIVKDRVELLRTFLPDVPGTKPIAVGFPGGAGSYVFDTQTCSVPYAWEGSFLDVSPVWDARGGNRAKLLGPKYLVNPPGQPWFLERPGETPNYPKRAVDHAYGIPMPFQEFFSDPLRIHFSGYSLDAAGVPSFRYAVDSKNGKASLALVETPKPVKCSVAGGLERAFVVDPKKLGDATVWHLVGTAVSPPSVRLNSGAVLKPSQESVPVDGTTLVLPQKDDRAVVVRVAAAPPGSQWLFHPADGKTWYAALRFTATNKPFEFSYTAWSLARNEESLIKALK